MDFASPFSPCPAAAALAGALLSRASRLSAETWLPKGLSIGLGKSFKGNLSGGVSAAHRTTAKCPRWKKNWEVFPAPTTPSPTRRSQRAARGAPRGAGMVLCPPESREPLPTPSPCRLAAGPSCRPGKPRRARVYFLLSGKIKIERGEVTPKGRGRQHSSQVHQGAQKLHLVVFLHLLSCLDGFPRAFRALFPQFFPSLSGYHHARPSKGQMPAAPSRGGGAQPSPRLQGALLPRSGERPRRRRWK